MIKIHDYGCKQPSPEMKAILGDQFFLAHRYYNALIEIERRKIECVRLAQRTHSDALDAATVARDAAAEELCRLRAAIKGAKSRNAIPVNVPELRTQAATIRGNLPALNQAIRDCKIALRTDPVLQAELARLQATYDSEKKAAYAASPLFWGSKNHIAQRIEQAVERSHGEYRFRRWVRDGLLYCQVMNGIDVPTMYACTDGRVQIERTAHPKLCKVRIRIGSNPDRSPRWAELETYIHRPFPEGSTITGVQIARRWRSYHRNSEGKFEPRDDYSVQFTCHYPASDNSAQVGDLPTIAIDLGWRVRPDNSLRVAKWYDTTGATGEFSLPRNLLNRWSKNRELQAIRDLNFNEAVDQLRAYVSLSRTPPTWLVAGTQHAHLWKSHQQLIRLLNHWERHAGDEIIYPILTQWREQEAHLEQWQRSNETKAQAIRQHLYRNWAAQLRSSYRVVVMEDMDVAQLRRNPAPEEDAESQNVYWRNAAAIGLLRSTIQGSCNVTLLPAVHTTTECHACGAANHWNRAELDRVCSACGVKWDQDENAARNLLQRWLATVVDETPPPETPRDGGEFQGRWQRRKANRSQTPSDAPTA